MASSRGSSLFEKNENLEEVDLSKIVTPEFPQDPFELLGEKYFGEPREIPETEIGTPVQEFYRDSSVFITGATGFVGSALVEKLLRSCPHIKRVYLLLRGKNGKTALQRYDQILQNRVFSRLKHEVPGFKRKLSVIDGDINLPDLGMTSAEMQQIINEVNVIFHMGASVRFNDSLKDALRTNTKGTSEILKIARKLKNLKALLHVSTIYSFCFQKTIEERVCSMSIDYEQLLKLMEDNNDFELAAFEAKLLETFKNTYQVTKCLTECLLQREAQGLPVAICRPSLVSHSYREPVRGWMGNRYGHIGRDIAINLGLVRVARGNWNDEMPDFVPVDFFVNFLICAAHQTFLKRGSSTPSDSTVQLYNFVNAGRAVKTCRDLYRITYDDIHRIWPLSQTHFYPWCIFVQNETLYKLLSIFLQTIPGTICDAIATMCGKKPMMMKSWKIIKAVDGYLSFFRESKWTFIHENTDNLWNSLSEKDKELFSFNFEDLNCEDYASTWTLGTRVYLLNDNIRTLPAARRRIKRLYYLHLAEKYIFYGFLFFMIYWVSMKLSNEVRVSFGKINFLVT